MKRFLNITYIIPFLVGIIFLQACKKEQLGLGNDPYAGGKEQLGVVFERLNRPLQSVRPNDVFEVSVRGLLKNKDKVKVFINEELAEVVSLTDSTMEVRVPELVSSGGLKVLIDDQIFFGPSVPIEGNVRFDTDYGIVNGFNGSVTQFLPVASGSDIWVVGNFTNFENEVTNTNFINSIHRITSLGKSAAVASGSYRPQKGYYGGINSIARLEDGKYIVAGGLYAAENLNKHRYNLQQITRLNSEGSIDSVVVELINTTPEKPLNAFDTVPAFNAYLGGSISGTVGRITNVFAMPDSGVIALGNFAEHNYINYDYSSRESKLMVSTKVSHIVRLKSNGRVDSTFGYNNVGANGFINGGIETSDGKIVVVGSFTSFNNKSSNRIIAFERNGQISTGFNVGTGANDEIFSITYNKTRRKIAVAGKFTSFNGKPTNGVVILNEDGSLDETFALGDIENRIPTYAYMMNNGKVLVSGDFIRYNGVHRSRILILESDGTALQQYNNIGEFSGNINHIIETTSSLGYPALLIGGSFRLADGRSVGNIFKLEIKD